MPEDFSTFLYIQMQKIYTIFYVKFNLVLILGSERINVLILKKKGCYLFKQVTCYVKTFKKKKNEKNIKENENFHAKSVLVFCVDNSKKTVDRYMKFSLNVYIRIFCAP